MKNDLIALANLTKRGIKLFLKDKAGVFFSLLAPLIVLLLYVLFLADVQISTMDSFLPEGMISENVKKAFVDGWMLAGAVSVSCITVSFSAQSIMVKDKETGNLADMLASPLKRGVLTASYFVMNFVISMVICLVVLAISFLYLAISGWYLSAADAIALVGTVALSVLSVSLISTLLCSFIKTLGAHGAFAGILSAAIGFLVGAYMPLSMFPKAVQYAVLFIPGTYSAGMFRNLFMRGAFEEISAISPEAAEGLSEGFSMKLDFFGREMNAAAMLAALAGFVLLFAAINFIVLFFKRKREKTG